MSRAWVWNAVAWTAVAACAGNVTGGPGTPDAKPADAAIGLDGFLRPDAPSADRDGDGIPDISDICPDVRDPAQSDVDHDLIGDACDNCVEVANRNQLDTNHNGVGDVCENFIDPNADFDGDGVPNRSDNCWRVANPGQADADRDRIGDACDNCPQVANFDQADSNLDGRGDACSGGPANADSDGDGVPDPSDNCPRVANPTQADADGDRVGDACDNCPQVANFDQADANRDGVGDACAGASGGYDQSRDSDGDGVPDVRDNCRDVPNAAQLDSDGDQVGDACDNCPAVANYTQDDLNANGVGDACEVVPANTPFCSDNSNTGTLVTPNLYFVIDKSGSMDWYPCAGVCSGDGCVSQQECRNRGCNFCSTTRWTELENGLNALATDLTRGFNVGLGAFPNVGGGSCSASMPAFERLNLRPGWTPAQFQSAYSQIQPGNHTPTQQALDLVRNQDLYEFSPDPVPGRSKAVVLITDGEPNCGPGGQNDSNVNGTIRAARDLFDQGVPVYVIGFVGLNRSVMDAIAEAGRGLAPTPTDDWYEVSDRTSIIAALRSIAGQLVSCEVQLTLDGSEDLSRIRVETVIDGAATPVARGGDGWSYNAAARTVTLLGSSCQAVQAAVAAGRTVSVRARVACPSCVPQPEVCDYVDNNCNGVIDEGCSTCTPEVCDGKDNDCDGLIDEGCPPATCIPAPEICDGKDNDCDGLIDEGCPPSGCIPSPEICNGRDDDCDGQVDEGCTPGCVPQNEICDGKDNDCDGLIDDGCPPPLE